LFNGRSPDELRAFIFQCQIYFRACEEDFQEDTDKIFFAISYLRGIALDYFEPYINEPDPFQDFDFLDSWSAFVQKLSNTFGSYSPEDDNENAIVSIPFPHDGKAVNYFIQFTKYQNRIRWDDRSLRKIVKDAIPSYIRNELRFSHEDTSSFEGFKRAIMRIDSDYWKRTQDDKNKLRTIRPLQTHFQRISRPDLNQPLPLVMGTSPAERSTRDRPRLPLATSSVTPFPSILGPDGQLTQQERQRCMSLGLYLRCGQTGHLVRTCPKQAQRAPGLFEARVAIVDVNSSLPMVPKNELMVVPPGELTA